MFDSTPWKHTRFYQEIVQETKLQIIPRFLKVGLSVEQIADVLELDIETVQQAITAENRTES
ncbi:hypothetical protein A6770_32000 [Nostoc minutum NIES-26]|uniref:Uncharacterized protein n=1 Tax=Nostoc minutum NIES-26 TaxID=1844469 RepID=A0A367Q840_9NOSO|nr:hypothetical protein A6770_32000 [Nostoc minutum NIES-26]